ncbi:MAG TPA: hypothetical protein VGA88_06980 [Burkholderiales bacterium]|jgi:hypothetical protein
MNAETETAVVPAGRPWINGRRRGWWLAGIAILAGVALGREWLAAIGALPILLSLLPCAAMCALGLCMNHQTGGACDQSKTETTEKPT